MIIVDISIAKNKEILKILQIICKKFKNFYK